VTSYIAIASCDALLPVGNEEDRQLVEACQRRGVRASLVSWSDQSVEWDVFDLTLIRSTWDYTARRSEFLRWLEVTPRVHNPAEVVAPNTDKVYLRDLVDAGLPVIPTEFVEPGQQVTFPVSGQFVVKPSVGAGSRGAGRFDADLVGEHDRAAEHAARLHAAGRTVLVQPYLTAVDTAGESAMIYLGGEYSHSIRKARMLAEGASFEVDGPALFHDESITPRVADEIERDVAERILAHLTKDANGPLLYARIDLLPSADGPMLIEAELTEPSLFLDQHAEATDRLVAAIIDRIG
jgi:glutathione synthase/RimK-type ligase-like ATP-grasp enzyme